VRFLDVRSELLLTLHALLRQHPCVEREIVKTNRTCGGIDLLMRHDTPPVLQVELNADLPHVIRGALEVLICGGLHSAIPDRGPDREAHRDDARTKR
jgi:hypothetical protein